MINKAFSRGWFPLFGTLVAAFASSLALAQTREASSSGVLLDRVAATVNEGVVLSSEVDEQVMMLTDRLRSQNVELPPQNVLRQQVLERLVLTELQMQRADRAGIKVSDEILNNAMRDLATQNRIRESLSLEERARADLEAARRNVAQATRSAYLGVVSGQGQVRALEAAEASSQSALNANRQSFQAGVRINIDVLNAQSQLFQTKRDLAQARYNVLLGTLKLRQAAGTLTLQDIEAINALLVKP